MVLTSTRRGLRGSRLALATLLLSNGLLAGCQNMSETRQGAGFGALLGAGAGAATGKKNGVLIGTVVGTVAGGVTGWAIQNRKEHFASAEQELQELTQRAQAVAVTQRHRAAESERMANIYSKQLPGLRQQIASGQSLTQVDQANLKQAINARDTARNELKQGREEVDALQPQIDGLKKKGQDTSQMEKEQQSIGASNRRIENSFDTLQTGLRGVEA